MHKAALRRLGLGSLAALSFLPALPLSFALSLRTPVARRLVASVAARALSHLGAEVEIAPPRQLGLTFVGGVALCIATPGGRARLRAEDAGARWSLPAVWRLFSSRGRQIDLTELRVRRLELTGNPKALAIGAGGAASAARPLRITLDRIAIDALAIFGQPPIELVASAAAILGGGADRLRARISARARAGELTLSGGWIGKGRLLFATARLRRFDARWLAKSALAKSAPPTSLALDAAALGVLGRTPALRVGATLTGEVGGVALPRLFAFAVAEPARLALVARAAEPGATAQLAGVARRTDAGYPWQAELSLTSIDLARWRRAALALRGLSARGSASLRARGVGTSVAELQARARLGSVRYGAFGGEEVEAHAILRLVEADRPRGWPAAEGLSGLAASWVVHARARAATMGRFRLARVTVQASGRAAAHRVVAREIAIVADSRAGPVVVRATRAWVGPGAVSLPRIEILGFGAPLIGSLWRRPGELALSLATEALSLATLAQKLPRTAWRWPDVRGTIAGRIAVRVAPHRPTRASAALALSDGAIGAVGGLSAQLRGDLSGRTARGSLRVAAARLGRAELKLTRLFLPGARPLSRASLLAASGQALFRVETRPDTPAELARLGVLTPESALARLRIATSLDAELTRLRSNAPAAARATLGLYDAAGLLVSVDARAELPISPRRLRSSALDRAPLDVSATLFERDLRALKSTFALAPSALGGATGRFGGSARLVGTLARPQATILLHAARVRLALLPVERPLDATVTATLAGDRAGGHAEVSMGGRRVASIDAVASGDFGEALARGRPPGQWRGSASALLQRFPLEAIAPGRQLHLAGPLSGLVAVEGWPTAAASLTAHLAAEVSVAGASVGRTELFADGDFSRVWAALRVAQAQGGIEARALVPLGWRAGLPVRDTDRDGFVALSAHSFDLHPARSLAPSAIAALEGRLDGHVLARLSRRIEPSGVLWWRDGRLQLASMGEPLVEASAVARLSPERVAISPLIARSGDGRIRASAEADLHDGAIERVVADVDVPKDAPIPIDWQGRSYGQASGTVSLQGRRQGRALRLDARVPALAFELAAAAPRVEPLGPVPRLQIGALGQDGFVPLVLGAPIAPPSAPALPIALQLHLGDVSVSRGPDVHALIGGEPRIDFGERTVISGTILLRGGSVTVSGHRFTIAGGQATFTGRAPGNPIVNASAWWVAPDGTRVIASFRGPAKSGKVELTSDPPRPKDEILALILFGNAEAGGAQGVAPTLPGAAPPAHEGAQPVAVAGGIVAPGLSSALHSLTTLNLSARIGTHAESPTAELELRIARSFSIAFATLLSEPAPGSTLDRNLASVDWHFHRGWSLDTTVGDQGSTSVDVSWRKRY